MNSNQSVNEALPFAAAKRTLESFRILADSPSCSPIARACIGRAGAPRYGRGRWMLTLAAVALVLMADRVGSCVVAARMTRSGWCSLSLAPV